MLVLGIICGLGEIVLGVLVLTTSQGQGIFIGMGIAYILSGLLFIWLCAGASQAFSNSKKINDINWKMQELEIRNKVSFEMLKKLGISEEDISKELSHYFIGMKEGEKLVALVEKRTPDNTVVIPKGTIVSFVKIELKDDGAMQIITKANINGFNLTIAYKEEEVTTESNYQSEQIY